MHINLHGGDDNVMQGRIDSPNPAIPAPPVDTTQSQPQPALTLRIPPNNNSKMLPLQNKYKRKHQLVQYRE
jgi:hypothetical protein